MDSETEFPEPGETVIVRITKVLDYGTFVELLEYDGIKGFVHVSQVSSGWVKNIRNFVKEGQIRAAKVQNINLQKNQIDLSLTKVSPKAQRAKINEYKQLKRERKLIEALAKRQKKSFDQAWDEVAEPLLRKCPSLVEAFQKISIEGKGAAEGVSPEWIPALLEMVDKSIVVQAKTVKGILKIRVLKSDGIGIIRKALEKGISASKEAQTDISYLGSGKYLLRASSHDFKLAEKALGNAAKNVLDFLDSQGGKASFERVEEK